MGVEGVNSQPGTLPKDSAAGFTGWDYESTETQVGGPSYFKTSSCMHKATDLTIGKVPLSLSLLPRYPLKEVISLESQHTIS